MIVSDWGHVARSVEGCKRMSRQKVPPAWASWCGRATRVVVATSVVACFMAAFVAVPTMAAWGSPEAVGSGGLSNPLGVAVEESTGDLYAANLIFAGGDKFDLAHELLSPPSPFGGGTVLSGLTLNAANDRVYAVNGEAQTIQSFDPSTGEKLGEFSIAGSANYEGAFTIVQIASDASGNVYLPNAPNNEVQVFGAEGGAPSGGVVATIKGEGANALSGPTGVAVDSSGHVWVADDGNSRVEEFELSGEFIREIPASGVQSVAVDASDDIFASVVAGAGPHIVEFDATGTKIEEFGLGTLNKSPYSVSNVVAVDNAHQIVYVSDGEPHNVVWAFTKRPVVNTESPAAVSATGATLRGSVKPGGEPVSSCEFEYAPESEYKIEQKYEHAVACAQTPTQIGSGNEPVQVSAEVTGLEADEIYHFRLRASNAAGPSFGADESFVAIGEAFGFQMSGPNALEMVVSNSADPGEPAAANPADLDTQAGSHPFDVTTRFLVNSEANRSLPPNLQPKDYYVNVPAGFAGSVANVPRCKMSELSSLIARQKPPGCATDSQVGVIRLFEGASAGGGELRILPVYNMVPPPGVPAELAFPFIEVAQPVVFQLRSDGDYGITAKVHDISEIEPIVGSQLTLWGVPADPAHDAERFLPEQGAADNTNPLPGDNGVPLPAGTAEVPFLTNPTKCGAQEDATITADSWLHPGQLAEDGLPVPGGEGWVSAKTPMFPNGITGCAKLTFHPKLEIKPTTSMADSPSGLTVDVRVRQSEGPNNLVTPALKQAVVTLPQGLSISPSQANGLAGCTPAQIKLKSMAQPECPNASQVGKLELTTPLLPEPLAGQIYLSSERSGSTFHIYLVIEGQGVLIKLRGDVVANEQTGQLTSTFEDNPQLPFGELKLTFYGGPGAALATPNVCGSYRTASLLEPWSHYEADGEPTGTPNAEPAVEPFQISSGCVSGFAPGFNAGVTNPVAGRFSPFVLSFSRGDGEEELSGLRTTLPPGLVGKLAGVAECSSAQIAAAERNTGAAERANPSCPAASQIGTVESGAGPGSGPFFLPGKAYLTGPYKGGPYGIVVIVPVLAGPFDLGTVVVRSVIDIDPRTAQVSVTSDPLPTMLDGIPLKLRKVEVSIDRPRFTLNPTSCEPMKITGMLTSTGGSDHAVSSPFKVGDCASLRFKPGFKVSTKARHTKRFGAFLRVKVTSGPGQANIKSVLVKLPKALPSRVETLKGACGEKQFAENPAGCPAASKVGTAIARTPILSTPLTGPAIFVSHGGAAFPDLDVVLQGSGVTVILEGNTNIHHNITTSDFKSVPDVPVSSFELTLPTGPHSALAANGNLCFKTAKRGGHRAKRRVKLVMPTTITGQNGAVVHQSTHVAVKGCAGGARSRRG